MSDTEARDAYLGVEVDLPNGAKVTGNPVPYPDAVRMLLQSEQFYAGGSMTETIVPMLQDFERITGISQAKLLGLCPSLSLGEVVNLVQRFFFSRRSAPTAPPASPSSPSASSGA